MADPRPLPFDWADPFALDAQLSDEERMVRDTAEAFAQDRLQPRVTSAYLEERFDREIMTELGELGLLGATISPDYGGAGLNYVSYGLIARAVERVDSGYRSAMSVQSSPRDAPDQRLRLGGAAAEISAEARDRRMGRLLRPHRAGRGLRSRLDAHAGEEGGRRLSAVRLQDVDHQFADRRRLRGLGQVRRA